MKTIKDAYEELKGDLGNSFIYIGYNRFLFYCNEDCIYICYKQKENRISLQYICTVEEFNNYKGDDVKTIDWNEAPENCIGHSISSCMRGYWVLDNQMQIAAPDFGLKEVKFTPRIVTKPVYTQDMCDAGELPSVGESFLVGKLDSDSRIKDFQGEEVEVINISELNDSPVVITFYHPLIGLGCGVYYSSWVRPLTPPIELINGKVYQFDYKGVTRYAPYTEDINFFSDVDIHIKPDLCTNIKPLTVEGE